MRFFSVSIAALAAVATGVLAEEVGIDITNSVDCPPPSRKSAKGDMIYVHYRGTLKDGGKEFDTSYKRGQPLGFVVGEGQVIKGWDDNLIGMCIGDKRTLTIPPAFGYGDRTMGPIPGGSTLIFETELMDIKGVHKPEPVAESASSAGESASSAGSVAGEKVTDAAESVAGEATGGVKEAIASKVGEAAEALKVTIADTDGDGQEHNEL
ncbi:hypothetical protein BJ878DRAFT_485439 [Calycina marina]|uniref:peptidylprolyl isomerase n=1 Tax=Calycina marina TaxID=1763456 RepID=A0A9P7ZBU0_9HELO|nr:hypothetical protein BJ878DRAFT_485439 [Calycina marina]